MPRSSAQSSVLESAASDASLRRSRAGRPRHMALPLSAAQVGHNLLRQNVQRRIRDDQPIEISLADGSHQGRTLQQIVASADEKRPLGTAPRQWPERPTRCRATAIARGELICTTRSTVPISIPSSSEAVATSTLILPSFSFRLRVEAQLARQAAMMRGHVVFAQAARPSGAQCAPPTAGC